MAAAVGPFQEMCDARHRDGVPIMFGGTRNRLNAVLGSVHNKGILGSEREITITAGQDIRHLGPHAFVAAPRVHMIAQGALLFDSPDAEQPVVVHATECLILSAQRVVAFHNVRLHPCGDGRIFAGEVRVYVDNVAPLSDEDKQLLATVKSFLAPGIQFRVLLLVHETDQGEATGQPEAEAV